MTIMIKLIGLCALFHASNAAELKCMMMPDFETEGSLQLGNCNLVNSNNLAPLTIHTNSPIGEHSYNIFQYTHLTIPYRPAHSTQDYIHFKDEERALQAYTYYTPRSKTVTICSPLLCIQLPGVNDKFFITPEYSYPRTDCPIQQFIYTHDSYKKGKLIGACVSHIPPPVKGTIQVVSTSSSFFYFSHQPAAKYHIIDHRSSPPVEVISENVQVTLVGTDPTISLVHLVDYSSEYLSQTNFPSRPILGVTGTYFALQQRASRRYMVQTPTSLYSLLDSGNGISLTPEDESFYVEDAVLDRKRRIVLQVFPDAFTIPKHGLVNSFNYSALYKEAYGYENREVDRTVTGAYAFMAAMGYLEADKGTSEETALEQYTKHGATYLFSVPTFDRNVGAEKDLKKVEKWLQYYWHRNWDKVAQEAPKNDVKRTIHAKDAEGGDVWYGKSSVSKVAKGKGKGETGDAGKKTWKQKLWEVGRIVLPVVVVLGMIIFFVLRLRKKPSVDEVQPSSALLTREEQHII